MTVSPTEVISAPETAPARYVTRDQLIGRFSLLLPHIPLEQGMFEHRGTDRFARQVNEVALIAQGLLAFRSLNDPPDHEIAVATEHSLTWLLRAVEPSVLHIKAKYSFATSSRSDEDDFEQLMRIHMITKLLPRFNPKRAQFLMFFEKAAENRVLDIVRSERVAGRLNGVSLEQFFDSPDSDVGSLKVLATHSSDAHSTAIFHERVKLLANILSRKKLMSDEQRQAYIAVVLNGATETEYAERINAPLGTVKSWVRAARLKIIRKLELLGHSDYAADTP